MLGTPDLHSPSSRHCPPLHCPLLHCPLLHCPLPSIVLCAPPLYPALRAIVQVRAPASGGGHRSVGRYLAARETRAHKIPSSHALLSPFLLPSSHPPLIIRTRQLRVHYPSLLSTQAHIIANMASPLSRMSRKGSQEPVTPTKPAGFPHADISLFAAFSAAGRADGKPAVENRDIFTAPPRHGPDGAPSPGPRRIRRLDGGYRR